MRRGKPGSERVVCLQWLLENGADPELDGGPPSRALLIAAFTGVPEYIKILRDAGAKVDGFAHAALGDLAKVEPNPNLPDARGWTAVHQAASRGNERMLEAVFAAGGNSTLNTNDGHTPFEIARSQPSLA